MTGLRWPVRLLLLVAALIGMLALGARGVVALPDLVLIVVVAVALTAGSSSGALLGLLGGWLLDLAPPVADPLGLSALGYAAAGWVAGLARRRAGHPWWWPVPVVGVAVVVARVAPVLIDLASARPVAWGSLAWQVLATATLGLVLVGLVERLEAGLVRRRWS
ncbi:MAG: rod shape-determining protein MreD [Janibacter sp.]